MLLVDDGLFRVIPVTFDSFSSELYTRLCSLRYWFESRSLYIDLRGSFGYDYSS